LNIERDLIKRVEFPLLVYKENGCCGIYPSHATRFSTKNLRFKGIVQSVPLYAAFVFGIRNDLFIQYDFRSWETMGEIGL